MSEISLLRLVLSALIILFSFTGALAQTTPQKTRVVVGSIPIPFAICTNLGTDVTTISKVNGMIELPYRSATDTLEFRSIGYETRLILPGEDIGDEVALFENTVDIDAVKVTSDISPEEYNVEGLKGIEKLQLRSIGNSRTPGKSTDLLMNTGQVLVQQSQQGGGSPIIRGFEANRILLVVDGIRMNNAIYRSGHLQNAITVDANALEQVQVLMGPSSVRYGSDALGGVVHFQTIKPRFRRNDYADEWGATTSAHYLTNNNSRIFHARAEGGGEKWASLYSVSTSYFGDLRMGENRMHGDSTWGLVPYYVGTINGVDSVFENHDPHLQVGSGYTQRDFLQKNRIAIPGGAIQTNFQVSKSSNIPRFDKFNDINSNGDLKWAEWSYGPQNRVLGAITWEQYLGLPGSLHTTIAYQNIKESRFKRQFGSDFTERQFENVDVMSFSSYWQSSPFRGDGWGFECGIDGQWNNVESTSNSEDVVTRYPNAGSNMFNMGAFMTARRKRGDNILQGGLRFNFSSIQASYLPLVNSFEHQFEDLDSRNGSVTGSLAYEAPIGKRIETHTSFSSGFRHPNIDDAAKIREKGGFLLIPNPELKPEYIYSLDESITFYPLKDRSVSITTAGFVSLWADAIVPLAATLDGDLVVSYEGDPAIVQMNSNLDNAIITGGRAEIYAQLTETTRFSGTINYTKGFDILSGNPLSHIPPLFGRVGLSRNSSDWSIDTYILFNSAKDISLYGDASTDNLAEALNTGTPSWWTWNIETSYDLTQALRLQLGVVNILDVHYKPFSSGISSPGRGVYIALNTNF